MANRPRHVLITGGSRGIGLSIAQLFAKKGYRCTLISRSDEALQVAVSTLHPLPTMQPTTSTKNGISISESPSKHPLTSYHHSHITGDISHQTAFWNNSFPAALPRPARCPNHPSRIDVLVNCAGITQSNLFIKTSADDINRIVSTNLSSMMVGTKMLLRHGYVSGRGSEGKLGGETGDYFTPSIVNVSSLLGLSGGFGAVTYAASKAGVLGFTRALAAEYASHKVRVNAIVPGYVETDMTKGVSSDELKQRIPLGRFGKPEEIAQAALFLAENEYAHNCVLNLDGGLSAV